MADAWVFMAIIAFGVAAGIVMYGLGFMHGRDSERDRVSDLQRALKELRGPRVMRP